LKAGYIIPQAPDPSDDEVKMVVEHSITRLRCRPAELYVGAVTLRKQLAFGLFYDGNVYQENLVQEWLDEIKGATSWYLGQFHSGEGRTQAKL